MDLAAGEKHEVSVGMNSVEVKVTVEVNSTDCPGDEDDLREQPYPENFSSQAVETEKGVA